MKKYSSLWRLCPALPEVPVILVLLLTGCAPDSFDTASDITTLDAEAAPKGGRPQPLTVAFYGPGSGDIACGDEDVTVMSVGFENPTRYDVTIGRVPFQFSESGGTPVQDFISAGYLVGENGAWLADPEAVSASGEVVFDDEFTFSAHSVLTMNLAVDVTTDCAGTTPVSVSVGLPTRGIRASFPDGAQVSIKPARSLIAGDTFTFTY